MSAQPPLTLEARLSDASRSGVFFAQPTAAIRAARIADQAELLLIGLDLKDARDRAALLQAFAATFGFPDTFGQNMDALGDCLGDLSWLPANGYLVHLSGCAKPIEHCKDDFDAVVAVLEDAAAEWRNRGTPFWVLIDQPHTRIRPFMASA